MAIEKLPEFAKNGQKDTDKLNQEDGFPVNLKPARQWFNFLFNKLSSTINKLIDEDYLPRREIINDLTTKSEKKPLSAEMGRKLNDEKLNLTGGAISGTLTVDGALRTKRYFDFGYLETVNQERAFMFYSTGSTVRTAIRSRTSGALDFTNATSYSFDKAVKAELDGNAKTATLAEKATTANSADTATKLTTARTVQFSGAATGSFSYNGSANSSVVLTLANSGVTPGTFGSTKKTPVLTVNNKGQVTVATTVDMPEFNGGESGLVPARVGSTTNRFLNESGHWVATPNTNTTYAIISSEEMQAGTATAARTVNAKLLKETVLFWAPTPKDITGNAGSASKLDPGRKINGVHFDGTKDISCGFGVGQKWYDELSRRTLNTIYRNTTANPVFIEYDINAVPAQSNVKLFVNNEFYVYSTVGRPEKTIIIGPGDSYELRAYKNGVGGSPDTPIPATGFVLFSWEEYK